MTTTQQQLSDTKADGKAAGGGTRPRITRQPTWKDLVPYNNFGRALHNRDAGLCVEYISPRVLNYLIQSMLVLFAVCVAGSVTVIVLAWKVGWPVLWFLFLMFTALCSGPHSTSHKQHIDHYGPRPQ